MDRFYAREIATSQSGAVFATTDFEGRVTIWDLNTRKRVGHFQTIWDFGGRRLAISENGNYLAAGAYRRHGVKLYHSRDGGWLWERKDIKHVQHVQFDPRGRYVYVCTDHVGVRLDIHSGKTLSGISDATKIVASGYGGELVAAEREHSIVLLDDDLHEIKFTPKSSYVASMAFSESSLFFSEAVGNLRSFRLQDLSEQWQFVPPPDCTFLRIQFSKKDQVLFGVLWNVVTGGDHILYCFDAEKGGELWHKAIVGPVSEIEFAKEGGILITAGGDVYELSQNAGLTATPVMDFG